VTPASAGSLNKVQFKCEYVRFRQLTTRNQQPKIVAVYFDFDRVSGPRPLDLGIDIAGV
jgi:hypothetical protein